MTMPSFWSNIRIGNLHLSQLNLRQRIAGTMMALVTIAGLLLAVWALLANRRLEQNVTDDLLSAELSHYLQRLHQDPGTEPLQSAQLRIYRSRDIAELPREIARYAPGTYGPVRIDKRYLRVQVLDTEFGRLYITYDMTKQLVEQRIAAGILAVGVITTILLTAWLAYTLSGRLVDPVKQLAHRLSDINPGERQLRIANEFVGNELAPIASSIDTFLERLDGFVEREQSFTATASHELRTPLAVIQGAVELLIEQHAGRTHSQKALARIQRAVREMADFTDALLLLSREERRDEGADVVCDLNALLPRIVEDQQATTQQQALTLEIESTRTVRVAAPDSMVAMVIGNLIRNALQHSGGQRVQCTLNADGFMVSNQGNIPEAQLQHLFKRGYTTRTGGHGMGLYLARRICDRYGWLISLENSTDRVTAFIKFGESLLPTT
ncbi:MAG: HAMP domain-containing sensor histidine kinase [Steroidobacteraceae bacterium]